MAKKAGKVKKIEKVEKVEKVEEKVYPEISAGKLRKDSQIVGDGCTVK